jgi:hypothetical protein
MYWSPDTGGDHDSQEIDSESSRWRLNRYGLSNFRVELGSEGHSGSLVMAVPWELSLNQDQKYVNA